MPKTKVKRKSKRYTYRSLPVPANVVLEALPRSRAYTFVPLPADGRYPRSLDASLPPLNYEAYLEFIRAGTRLAQVGALPPDVQRALLHALAGVAGRCGKALVEHAHSCDAIPDFGVGQG